MGAILNYTRKRNRNKQVGASFGKLTGSEL